jgi:hypothetical protein
VGVPFFLRYKWLIGPSDYWPDDARLPCLDYWHQTCTRVPYPQGLWFGAVGCYLLRWQRPSERAEDGLDDREVDFVRVGARSRC